MPSRRKCDSGSQRPRSRWPRRLPIFRVQGSRSATIRGGSDGVRASSTPMAPRRAQADRLSGHAARARSEYGHAAMGQQSPTATDARHFDDTDSRCGVAIPKTRLHFIVARKAPVAVVFRRGPSRQVELLKWDLTTDELVAGDAKALHGHARRPGGRRPIRGARTSAYAHACQKQTRQRLAEQALDLGVKERHARSADSQRVGSEV